MYNVGQYAPKKLTIEFVCETEFLNMEPEGHTVIINKDRFVVTLQKKVSRKQINILKALFEDEEI